jgi:hypothetical protein
MSSSPFWTSNVMVAEFLPRGRLPTPSRSRGLQDPRLCAGGHGGTVAELMGVAAGSAAEAADDAATCGARVEDDPDPGTHAMKGMTTTASAAALFTVPRRVRLDMSVQRHMVRRRFEPIQEPIPEPQ